MLWIIVFLVFSGFTLDDFYSSCLAVPTSFCVGGYSNVISADAGRNAEKGKWTFDHMYPVDDSGNALNLHAIPSAGPSFTASGASAKIDPMMMIKTVNSNFTLWDFTLSFWVYPLTEISDVNATFIGFGDSFGIMKAQKATIALKFGEETLETSSSLLSRRWSNFAVTRKGSGCEFFVNGYLGNSFECKPTTIEGDLFIGSDKEFEAYFDDIAIFSKPLSNLEITVAVPTSISGILDTSKVALGCDICDLAKTSQENFCSPGYNICTNEEIKMYGFHVARINGWLKETTEFWTSDEKYLSSDASKKKLALCCKDDE